MPPNPEKLAGGRQNVEDSGRVAYAILDGGGVKGAALAGCLMAAEQAGVHFAGYGGTSAGSIVALLASLGYSAPELKKILIDTNFAALLGDEGRQLDRLKRIAAGMRSPLKACATVTTNLRFIRRSAANLGLYDGLSVTQWVRKLCEAKFPKFESLTDITFLDLKQAGCLPLKIVTSDLRSRSAVVCSTEDSGGLSTSVLDAVRASMSYPFVFQPVKVNNNYLVDGGLSSNLPLLVFEAERQSNPLPIIAFDLVASPSKGKSEYGFLDFCEDMLATALEAGEHIQRDLLRDLYNVRIPIPSDIKTLDFSLSRQDRERLYLIGFEAASTYFREELPHWAQAKNSVEALQARYAPTHLVSPVLRAIASDFARATTAKNIRVNVMLVTPAGTRRIVYQYGMDNDSDRGLEIGREAGTSGLAFTRALPALVDLPANRERNAKWGLTPDQYKRIRKDRRGLLSVPVFDRGLDGERLKAALPVLGTLNIDSANTLTEAGWADDASVIDLATEWAGVLTRVLR